MDFHISLSFEVVFFLVVINSLTFTMLVESVMSADSRYEACMPQTCGTGPSICYPFRIFNKTADICGQQGFDVICDQNKPIYMTSGAQYLIQDISYEDQSFHLVDVEIDQPNTTCFAPQQNFSFDPSSLNFQSSNSDLVFLYNCSGFVPIGYPESLGTCSVAANIMNFSVGLVPRGKASLDKVPCESLVFAPVELNGTVAATDYKKLLANGFTMEWNGMSCAECRSSGGNCGLNDGTLVCFCPDGSHSKNCSDDTSTIST